MSFISMIIFFTLCVAAVGNHLTIEEAKQLLSTSEKMWMIQRSSIRYGNKGAISCVNVRKINVVDAYGDRYTYDYSHKEGETWVNTHIYVTPLQGTEDDGDPIIDVSREKDESEKQYRLRFWDLGQHCAILTISSTEYGGTVCEMYQWENNIQAEVPYSCDSKFDELCPHQKHAVNKHCFTSTG
uniref:Lipocalin/cytosolic fatty-acid binding domain-containing protein n=1 Tax=Amblyomma maculatum TaxID=34609 RepID=G3ML79_AMBMU